MFLGALERRESLVYNAPKNIEIRSVFVKLQYQTSSSYRVVGNTEKYRYFLLTTVPYDGTRGAPQRPAVTMRTILKAMTSYRCRDVRAARQGMVRNVYNVKLGRPPCARDDTDPASPPKDGT